MTSSHDGRAMGCQNVNKLSFWINFYMITVSWNTLLMKATQKNSQNQWQEEGNRQPKWPLCCLFLKDPEVWRHDSGCNICSFALFMWKEILQKHTQRSNYSN